MSKYLCKPSSTTAKSISGIRDQHFNTASKLYNLETMEFWDRAYFAPNHRSMRPYSSWIPTYLHLFFFFQHSMDIYLKQSKNCQLQFQANVNFRFMGLRDKYHSPADLPMATSKGGCFVHIGSWSKEQEICLFWWPWCCLTGIDLSLIIQIWVDNRDFLKKWVTLPKIAL